MCRLFNSSPPYPEIRDKSVWEQLAVVCNLEAQEDKAHLFSLLWAMDAPENLQNFHRALNNMRRLLPYLDSSGAFSGEEKRCWESLLDRVQNVLGGLTREQLESLSLEELVREKTTGVLTRHPWYGVFLFLGDFPDQEAAMGITARIMWRMWFQAEEDSENIRYRLSLAIRVLFGELHTLQDEVDIAVFSDTQIARFLESLLGGNTAIDEEHILFLIRYLHGETESRDYSVKKSGYRRRSLNCFGVRGNPRETKRKKTSLLQTDNRGLAEPECRDLDIEKVEQVHFPLKGAIAREMKIHGLWARDCTTDLLQIEERMAKNSNARAATDRLRKHYRKKQISAEISRNAQPVPFLWSVLTPWELLLMLKELPALANSDPDLAVLLLICFIKGVDVETALKIRYRPDECQSGKAYFEIDQEGRCVWWLPTFIGIRLGKGSKGCLGFGETPDSHFRVRFSPVLNKLFQFYLRRQNHPHTPGSRITRLKGTKTVSDALGKWISQVNRRYRTRLTLLRISRYLAARGRADSRMDPVHLAYLRSRYELESETQIYYTRTLPEAIESNYHAFWDALLDEIHQEWRLLKEPLPDWLMHGADEAVQQELILVEEREGIGAHKVPTRETVRSMVRRIHGAMNKAESYLPVSRRTIEYHNQYMLYTLTYLTWASGYRAVSSPLPDPRLLDHETGLLLISDKDAEDGYCSRFVWISEDCRHQVQHYLDHLQALSLRMAGYAPDNFRAFRKAYLHWASRPPTIGTRRWRVGQDTDAFTPFVYLDQQTFKPVRPGIVRKLLPNGLQLPLDSNRHYLRSFLLHKGCDSALIDTQMGHWHHGHEPWAKASSLAPLQYAKVIKPYMTTMLEELGFRSCPSREVV